MLPDLQALLVDLRVHRNVLTNRRLAESLASHAPTNGGGDGARRFAEAALHFSRGLGKIDRWNVILRDLDKGLCDFPSARRGTAIYLCWEMGEPEVAFWHGVDEGAAGRKPLGPDD